MLVPIGSHCRTAYQVNSFLACNGVQKTSYPFDWTITPPSSLRKVLATGFDIEEILRPECLVANEFGSITDKTTELIHHHDFLPSDVAALREKSSDVNEKGVPAALFETDLIEKAKARFRHTFKNFEMLKQNNGTPVFVRWRNTGYKSPLPISIFGEIMKEYLQHDKFLVLNIKSELTDRSDSNDSSIVSYEREDYGVSATILERPGFDGDGSDDYRGDTRPWSEVLTRFMADENRSLVNNDQLV